MGEKFNTEYYEGCPMISHDGKYLFFTRSVNRKGEIFWIDANVIDSFRPDK